MGVFSKLKGIFYDEVEVEDDDKDELEKVSKIVKKEPKAEIPKIEEVKYKTVSFEPEEEEEPKEEEKEPKADNTFDERDLFRSERTFNFVDFGDDEEEEEKEPPRRNVLSEQNRTNKYQEAVSAPETPKVFKPTPVISPIWGVLDKDYKKDEIQTKTLGTETLSSAVTSYDNVRRKAYGTLEDELEDTINSTNAITTEDIKQEEEKKEKKKEDKELDEYEQKTAKIEDLISKIDEATTELDKTASIGELEDKVELENFEDDEEETEEENILDKTLTSSTLEHDLFNLIDSMYDDKEE